MEEEIKKHISVDESTHTTAKIRSAELKMKMKEYIKRLVDREVREAKQGGKTNGRNT